MNPCWRAYFSKGLVQPPTSGSVENGMEPTNRIVSFHLGGFATEWKEGESVADEILPSYIGIFS